MANTYKALQTVTVGAGGAASIAFTNIPQTYTDLVIKVSARSTYTGGSNDGLAVTFNNNTSNYTFIQLYGAGSSTAASNSGSSSAGPNVPATSATSNTFGNADIYVANYVSSNNKSVSIDGVGENNATEAIISAMSQRWMNSSPITSITIASSSSNNLTQHSTATLYGVFNADVSSAPATPTIGTATKTGIDSATVGFTGVSNAASYTATSTPDNVTATGTTSPITVTGLTPATSYTFKVKSNNPFGSSAESAASNSITTDSTAFESIATVSVGAGGAANIEFTSIPSTFTHLQIRGVGRSLQNASGFDNPWLRLNGDTGSNYNAHRLYSDGTSVAGDSFNTTHIRAGYFPLLNDSPAQAQGAVIIDIFNYTSTNRNKVVRLLSGCNLNGSGFISFQSGLWRNTNAITSLSIAPSGGNWAQYTHFALYGIRSA